MLGAARRAAIDLRTAYDTIGESVVAAPFVHHKRDAFLADGMPPVAFAVDLVRKDLTVRVYPGARHEILNETNRAEVVGELLAWAEKSSRSTVSGTSPRAGRAACT